MRAFILTPTYRVVDDVPEVHLYGVLESGEPCLVVDDRSRPYFFVRESAAAVLRELAPRATVKGTDLRTFDGVPVVEVSVRLPSDVPPLRERLQKAGVEALEADVRFAYRYLIDRGLRGGVTVDGPSHRHPSLGHVYRNPEIAPCAWKPRLKVLSIDIETSMESGHVLSLAMHGDGISHVLLVGHRHAERAEPVHSERALIVRFLEYVRLLDPDVITGWNVVDFDLAVLAAAAARYGIRFTLGRGDEAFERRRDPSFTRESRAVVYGRLVLDGLALVRGAFLRLQDYKLETAARELIGEGKLIAGDHRGKEIERLYREDPQRLVDYNLKDAQLVAEILSRTGLIDLAIERSLLTGMPLDRVSAAVASADMLYLRELRRRGVVAPSVGAGEGEEESWLTGGYVFDSKPGLYRNVLVFDFKSLYPSIIRTFNLDPLTLVRGEPADTDLVAPNGARFRRDVPGILPALVADLAREREQATRAGQKVKSQAIKILMNSLYGVLGSTASRLFFPPVANAITHFGQFLIRTAARYAEERGYAVIYGDTDSLFVVAGSDDSTRALTIAEELREAIGTAIAREVEGKFGCRSHLELEFEKLYRRFFLPEVRSGKGGSKKRYAGLLRDDAGREEIEFVGLESVRRDWSEVSKRFQKGLLDLVFHERPVEGFVAQFVADLRAGKFDAELAYRKAVRKDLDAYTKTTPPHVRAARKQQLGAGRIVEYVMTRNGPEAVGEETAPPDYAHYIEHQLRPVGDAILRFLGTDFGKAAGLERQLSLF